MKKNITLSIVIGLLFTLFGQKSFGQTNRPIRDDAKIPYFLTIYLKIDSASGKYVFSHTDVVEEDDPNQYSFDKQKAFENDMRSVGQLMRTDTVYNGGPRAKTMIQWFNGIKVNSVFENGTWIKKE